MLIDTPVRAAIDSWPNSLKAAVNKNLKQEISLFSLIYSMFFYFENQHPILPRSDILIGITNNKKDDRSRAQRRARSARFIPQK